MILRHTVTETHLGAIVVVVALLLLLPGELAVDPEQDGLVGRLASVQASIIFRRNLGVP